MSSNFDLTQVLYLRGFSSQCYIEHLTCCCKILRSEGNDRKLCCRVTVMVTVVAVMVMTMVMIS